MEREEAIQFREELLNKATCGYKLTTEEKSWLRNTPSYSKILGSDYFKFDILQLEPRTKYLIKLECKHLEPDVPIMPILSIPMGSGGYLQMDTKFHDNIKVPNKKKRSMNFRMDIEHPVHVFFKSPTGTLSIAYYCWVIKNEKAFWWSSTSFPSLAMEKRVVAENKVVYGCANAFGTKDSIKDKAWFNKFVFSVEWIRM